DGEFDGFQDFALEAVHRLVDIGLACCNPLRSERSAVELAGEASQRLIALTLHGFDDGSRLVHIRAEIGFRALEQARPFPGREALKLEEANGAHGLVAFGRRRKNHSMAASGRASRMPKAVRYPAGS